MVPVWPELTNKGYLTGRAATENDVGDGNAAFVLRSNGQPVGQPIAIEIPQYAFHVDERTGPKWPCVLIQAESAGDRDFAGVRYVDGKVGVALLRELQLLGAKPPQECAAEVRGVFRLK